jgi:hypothetical protein
MHETFLYSSEKTSPEKTGFPAPGAEDHDAMSDARKAPGTPKRR